MGGQAAAEVNQGLPQASGGRKEYVDEKGNVTKVVAWFGFKLHLLAVGEHEVALADRITDNEGRRRRDLAGVAGRGRGESACGTDRDVGL